MSEYVEIFFKFASQYPVAALVMLGMGLLVLRLVIRIVAGALFGALHLGGFSSRGLLFALILPFAFASVLWAAIEHGNIPYVSAAWKYYKRWSNEDIPQEASDTAVDLSDPLVISVLAGIVAFFIFTVCAMVFLRWKTKERTSDVNYLVLLRHGQSQWNLENRFTGFHDIDLSDLGREEAAGAGKRLKDLGVKFDAVYTSTLQRAFNTAQIALTNAGQEDMISKIVRHDDLRERDYGDLTGLNKDETRAKYGDEQVHIWRRSYDVCPPGGECLQDVVEKRVRPYYAANIAQQLLDGKNVLVAAHGNSLRALLIILGAETPETINMAEMETGVPVVFEMEDGKILKRYSLTDKKSAA